MAIQETEFGDLLKVLSSSKVLVVEGLIVESLGRFFLVVKLEVLSVLVIFGIVKSFVVVVERLGRLSKV